MRKNDYWRNRIFRDGEQRYIDQVLRPAFDQLAESRRHLLERMPDERSEDTEIVALFQAEIARIDSFEARLNQHLKHTNERFARLAQRR